MPPNSPKFQIKIFFHAWDPWTSYIKGGGQCNIGKEVGGKGRKDVTCTPIFEVTFSTTAPGAISMWLYSTLVLSILYIYFLWLWLVYAILVLWKLHWFVDNSVQWGYVDTIGFVVPINSLLLLGDGIYFHSIIIIMSVPDGCPSEILHSWLFFLLSSF